MDINSLNYIVTIAQEKGISKAAAKLYITPSALSQCLKKIEIELGQPLFERFSGHIMRPTTGGRIYLKAAQEILKIRDDAYQKLKDEQNSDRGSFVFGCSPKRGLTMLAHIFPFFYKAYPNVQINLLEAYLNMQYDMVINGQVDLAVLTPLDENLQNVNMELLDREEIMLAVPASHPLISTLPNKNNELYVPLTDLSKFASDNWIVTSHATMLRNLTDDIFAHAGFYPKRILLESSSTDPHYTAINEGIAVCLVPKPSEAKLTSTVFCHLEPRQYRNLYAIYRKSYTLSVAQQYFISLMKGYYSSSR